MLNTEEETFTYPSRATQRTLHQPFNFVRERFDAI